MFSSPIKTYINPMYHVLWLYSDCSLAEGYFIIVNCQILHRFPITTSEYVTHVRNTPYFWCNRKQHHDTDISTSISQTKARYPNSVCETRGKPNNNVSITLKIHLSIHDIQLFVNQMKIGLCYLYVLSVSQYNHISNDLASICCCQFRCVCESSGGCINE